MKKLNFIFRLLIGILIITSCSSENTDGNVNIRITNVSEEDYQNVSVLDFTLENLESGESTEFMQFEIAYRIASVNLEIDGEPFNLQVIDFVGEELLPAGNYTYEIGLNVTGEFLTFNLVKE